MFFNKFLTLLALAFCLSLSPVAVSQNRDTVGPTQVGHSPNPSPRLVFVREQVREVLPGDNAWNIAQDAFGDGMYWRDVVAQNPFLRYRLSQDKASPYWFYVNMHPGEYLTTYNFTHPQVIVKDSAINDTVYVPEKGSVNPPIKDVPPVKSEENYWPLIAFLIGIAIIIAVILAGRRWMDKDVATSGPPQIQGGVNPTNVIGVIESRTGGRVIAIKKVRVYGKGKAFYNFKPMTFNNFLNELYGKRFNGEVDYEALILMSDGTRKTVHCLEACGNDANQGRYIVGLTSIPFDEQPTNFVEINRNTPPEAQEEKKDAETQNLANPVVERQNDGSDFNWVKGTLDLIGKCVEKGTPVFCDVTAGDKKFRFDTTSKPAQQKAGTEKQS